MVATGSARSRARDHRFTSAVAVIAYLLGFHVECCGSHVGFGVPGHWIVPDCSAHMFFCTNWTPASEHTSDEEKEEEAEKTQKQGAAGWSKFAENA